MIPWYLPSISWWLRAPVMFLSASEMPPKTRLPERHRVCKMFVQVRGTFPRGHRSRCGARVMVSVFITEPCDPPARPWRARAYERHNLSFKSRGETGDRLALTGREPPEVRFSFFFAFSRKKHRGRRERPDWYRHGKLSVAAASSGGACQCSRHVGPGSKGGR